MSRGRHARASIVVLLVPLVTGLVGIEASGAPAGPSLSPTAEQPALTDRVDADKAPTSRLAETDQKLLGRTDSAMVPVMIKLDYDSVATYSGGIAGLDATSPSVTGRALAERTPARHGYEAYVAGKERSFTADLAKLVPQAAIGQPLRLVYGGFAARVPANRIADVAAMDGVVAVQEDALNQLHTDASPEFLGAPSAYGQLGGGTANAGQGVIYGNLDTGVWPEHPSFADLGNLPAPPGPARACDFGDNPLTPAEDPFVCQNKLIGGQAFLAGYLSDPDRAAREPFHTSRDSNGHGTHTASTSAGNMVEDVSVLGGELSPIHGLAPGAWVMEYKVCGIDGCVSSDSAAAVQQAILDGVDVINFSISGGTNPFTDPVELAFLDAYAAGVFVSASAGNAGPTAGTANHLSPWVATVAASTQTREFATTLSVTADNGDVYTVDGASITPGVDPLPIVLSSAAPYSSALCTEPAAPGTFTGMIVACERGGNARVEKGFNVLQGGAAGMVLYNVPPTTDIETDTHYLPTVHLVDGTDLVAFLNGHTGETASFPAGAARDGQGDVMAAFSSRGPAGNFIKPDVTAPGVQVLAGDTPWQEDPATSGPEGEYFQAIAGTSMSSPHNAGAAILLRAIHTDWTPGQVKSALMTTALQDVVKEDFVTPADPFDYGAGRIQLHNSWKPGLTFDESAANMALLGNDPVNAVHINIPSINAPVMPGRVSTVRTAKNVSGLRQQYTAETTAPAGASITVLPRRFALDPGQSVNLTVTIASTAPAAQYFGEVRLVPRRAAYPTLHLPVAFRTGQSSVNLSSSCSPTHLPLQGVSTCQVSATNNSFNDASVSFKTTLNKPLKVVGADGAFIVNNRTVEKPNVSLAGATPGVPSVADGTPPAGVYLPLEGFGIAPIAIGDEQILNFNVPGYSYNGVTFTRLGIDSNGYVLAGGGTSEDNNCCNLPAGPDPARPNNMLAPFWTDLDGTGAPGIRVATLTDGVSTWIVVQYNVNVFGTTDQRAFQTWIAIGATQDITYAYAAPQGDPNGQPFLVGAENVIGQGDMEAVLPAADKRVTSSAPTPGASVSYSVTVKAVQTGIGTVTSEMHGPGLPGTTVVVSQITITDHGMAAV